MNEVFVDTGFWIALLDRSDRHHAAAAQAAPGLTVDYVWVTTNYVIHETLTYLNCSLKAHGAAVRFLSSVREAARTGFLVCIRVDAEYEDKALDLFVRYEDKDFSVADCASFAVMQERRITVALGFDDHFKQMGLHLLP